MNIMTLIGRLILPDTLEVMPSPGYKRGAHNDNFILVYSGKWKFMTERQVLRMAKLPPGWSVK